jgi:hypothetical protein
MVTTRQPGRSPRVAQETLGAEEKVDSNNWSGLLWPSSYKTKFGDEIDSYDVAFRENGAPIQVC